jgi:hypothetical protein
MVSPLLTLVSFKCSSVGLIEHLTVINVVAGHSAEGLAFDFSDRTLTNYIRLWTQPVSMMICLYALLGASRRVLVCVTVTYLVRQTPQ